MIGNICIGVIQLYCHAVIPANRMCSKKTVNSLKYRLSSGGISALKKIHVKKFLHDSIKACDIYSYCHREHFWMPVSLLASAIMLKACSYMSDFRSLKK